MLSASQLAATPICARLLEGRRSSVSRELGSALPDQSATQSQAAEQTLADDQPGAFADPRARRTRLSDSQATVGVRQSEISRSGQEPGASADYVCPGQSLPVSA